MRLGADGDPPHGRRHERSGLLASAEMNAPARRRAHVLPLALIAGLAWIAGVLLVATQADSDPVGARYDDYNRILTVALVLLLASTLALRRSACSRPLTALAGGFALMLAGNALEFWGAYAAGEPAAATASRLHAHAFAASGAGFGIFIAGGLTVLGSFAALARDLRRLPRRERLLIGTGGIFLVLGTALWAVSPAAAAIPAVIFAFVWLTVAVAVLPLPSSTLPTA